MVITALSTLLWLIRCRNMMNLLNKLRQTNHYSRDRITAEDIARFDAAIDEYEAKQEATSEELVEITDAE